MGKYIINGFVYEVIGNVITVQPVQSLRFNFIQAEINHVQYLLSNNMSLMNY
jgi:hypothetical protein